VAMEPPVGPEAKFLQDEKAKVFAAMRADRPRRWSAASTSATATSPVWRPTPRSTRSLRLGIEIDSWRWAGVPWYVRCGKALTSRRPRWWSSSASRRRCCSTRPAAPHPQRNLVRFRLGKHDGVTFTVQAKTPGQHLDSQIDLAVDFAAALGERREAYERLLDDAIAGSSRRFAREDVVEETWRVVQPALDAPGPVHPYFRGSWGPAEADRILCGDRWFEPS
jgi:glucose-6-phosphate 1-dehydrogenase